ncbi:hypothetical protein JXB41_08210 [Candidatus Woesearchaeota archaeon]|nr:hypothetical protein [Candidatus Woesearchaeota archaeon]
MFKKSQLTIVLIVGILLLVTLGFFVFSSTNKQKNIIRIETSEMNYQSNKDAIHFFLESCLKETVLKASEEIGIDESKRDDFKKYIEDNLVLNCVNSNLVTLDENGINLQVEGDEIDTNVEISPEKTIVVDLTLPVSFQDSDNTKISLDKFKFYFALEESAIIPTDTEGVVETPFSVISEDEKFEVYFPKGARFVDSLGNPVTDPEITLNLNPIYDPNVLGQVIYELSPDDIKIEGGAAIIFRPGDSDDGSSEDNTIVYLNGGVFRAVPTYCNPSGECIATTDHFSSWTLHGTCGRGDDELYLVFDGSKGPFMFNINNPAGISCIQEASVEYLYLPADKNTLKNSLVGTDQYKESEEIEGYGDCFFPDGGEDYPSRLRIIQESKQKIEDFLDKPDALGTDLTEEGTGILKTGYSIHGLEGHTDIVFVLKLTGTDLSCLDEDISTIVPDGATPSGDPVITWQKDAGISCKSNFSLDDYLELVPEENANLQAHPNEKGGSNYCYCSFRDRQTLKQENREFPPGIVCEDAGTEEELEQYESSECFKNYIHADWEKTQGLEGDYTNHIDACHSPVACGYICEGGICKVKEKQEDGSVIYRCYNDKNEEVGDCTFGNEPSLRSDIERPEGLSSREHINAGDAYCYDKAYYRTVTGETMCCPVSNPGSDELGLYDRASGEPINPGYEEEEPEQIEYIFNTFETDDKCTWFRSYFCSPFYSDDFDDINQEFCFLTDTDLNWITGKRYCVELEGKYYLAECTDQYSDNIDVCEAEDKKMPHNEATQDHNEDIYWFKSPEDLGICASEGADGMTEIILRECTKAEEGCTFNPEGNTDCGIEELTDSIIKYKHLCSVTENNNMRLYVWGADKNCWICKQSGSDWVWEIHSDCTDAPKEVCSEMGAQTEIPDKSIWSCVQASNVNAWLEIEKLPTSMFTCFAPIQGKVYGFNVGESICFNDFNSDGDVYECQADRTWLGVTRGFTIGQGHCGDNYNLVMQQNQNCCCKDSDHCYPNKDMNCDAGGYTPSLCSNSWDESKIIKNFEYDCAAFNTNYLLFYGFYEGEHVCAYKAGIGVYVPRVFKCKNSEWVELSGSPACQEEEVGMISSNPSLKCCCNPGTYPADPKRCYPVSHIDSNKCVKEEGVRWVVADCPEQILQWPNRLIT